MKTLSEGLGQVGQNQAELWVKEFPSLPHNARATGLPHATAWKQLSQISLSLADENTVLNLAVFEHGLSSVSKNLY